MSILRQFQRDIFPEHYFVQSIHYDEDLPLALMAEQYDG